jgi:methyltransferase
MNLSMFHALVTFLVVLRGIELVVAAHNGRWARKQGGIESGRRQYPIIVGMHVLFYVSLVVEHDFISRGWSAFWPLWLVLLGLAEAFRIWTMVSLGRFWNTRIIVIPGQKPVVKGPYRFLRHPNYLVVAIEFLLIPVLCGAYLTAIFFSAANALVLRTRIRKEEQAMQQLVDVGLIRLPRFIPKIHPKPFHNME